MKVWAQVGMFTTSVLNNDFYFSLMLGLMNFSDTAILCSGPNSCCQQNPKCSDKLLNYKYVFQTSTWLRPIVFSF